MIFARFAAAPVRVLWALAIVTAGALPLTVSSYAQDAAVTITDVAPGSLTPEQIETDRAAWQKSDCASCHGWSGNGHDTGPVPPGPSLRATELEFVDIREVIQCGRPGTNMPSHDRLAYTDDRCYGMTSADVGADKPVKGLPLKPAELDAIASYVAGYLKGRTDITKDECEGYYGVGTAACSAYK